MKEKRKRNKDEIARYDEGIETIKNIDKELVFYRKAQKH